MTLQPVPLAKRRAYFEELFEYCEVKDDEDLKLKRYSIERWAVKKRLTLTTIENWASEDEYCGHLYSLALSSIGARIEDGIIDREKNDKYIGMLYVYLKRMGKHNIYEDNRKAALAAEGVIPGQTKVYIVNENVKEEK